MKPVVFALLLVGCATAAPRAVTVEPRARPVVSTLPPLQLREMTLGASLPTRLLGQLARTKSMDSIMGAASPPAAAQQFPCSTGPGVGTWQGPACFTSFLISATGSTTSATSMMGWTNFTTGNAMQLQFGDLGSAMQGGYGDRLQLFGYHGIKILGGRASTTAPAFEAGSGNSDPSLTVVGNLTTVPALVVSGGQGLRIDGAGTGTPISSSLEANVTVSGVSAPAATCTSVATVTLTSVTGGTQPTCETSQTSTNGVQDATCIMRCGTTGTNTVALFCCNIGATHSVTGNWIIRILNN